MLLQWSLLSLRWYLKSQLQTEPKLVGEGLDPCQLQEDAVSAITSEIDQDLRTLQERSMQLMICRMGQMMPLRSRKAGRESSETVRELMIENAKLLVQLYLKTA